MSWINRSALLFLLCAFQALALPVNLVDGEILYKESCIECHQGNLEEESYIFDMETLTDKIGICAYYLNLPWNEQDIQDTAGYLDKKYFDFDPLAKPELDE